VGPDSDTASLRSTRTLLRTRPRGLFPLSGRLAGRPQRLPPPQNPARTAARTRWDRPADAARPFPL